MEIEAPPSERDAPAAERSAEPAERVEGPSPEDEVERLLRAGFDEIRQQGSVEPRVADIVRRAGLSNKAFYRHFRSKDELILAILEQGMRRRVRIFEGRLAELPSAAERVRAWIRTVQEQAVNREYADVTRPFCVYQARLTEDLGEQLWSHTDRLRAPLEEALEEGTRNGEFRQMDVHVEAVNIYWLAMGWMQSMVLRREVPTQAQAEAVVDFALRAVQSDGSD